MTWSVTPRCLTLIDKGENVVRNLRIQKRLLMQDVENPRADKRYKAILFWPVIPKGTYIVLREYECDFGMPAENGEPKWYPKAEVSIHPDSHHSYHDSLHNMNGHRHDAAGYNELCSRLITYSSIVPEDSMDFLRRVVESNSYSMKVLAWLIDRRIVSQEQVSEAVKTLNAVDEASQRR